MSSSKLRFTYVSILNFLLFTALAFYSSRATTYASNETDHQALLAFKSLIEHDPQGALSSWNDSSHYCQWKGVGCSKRHKRVNVLDLRSSGLVGSLSPYIGNLSFLREITLHNNTLKGMIPPELGRLFRLQILDLQLNSFEGEISSTIGNCSSLTFLALAFNKLVGEIPEEIGSLSKLTDLWVHVNRLTSIHPSIGNLTSLQTFSAVTNHLATLPDTIGQLQNMRELDLGNNNLSGVIPPSIFNLSLVVNFSISYNKLSGTLPPDVGLTMPMMKLFQLGRNEFTGTLPLSLSNASELERIDIPYNYFSGKVSVNFASLQNLWGVVLGGNKLGSGEPDELGFIRSLANCSSLHVIELSENQLKGELPKDVGNFSTNLFYFSLMRNYIRGEIPSWMSNLFSLTQLLLEENELVGNVPYNIGNLYKLQKLALDYNKLSGAIPASIGNLSFLNELYLGDNMLNGSIPYSLGACKQLSILELYQNNISGTIPEKLFGNFNVLVSLNLSSNHLSGTLPVEVGKLVKLETLDVSENEFSAAIPDTIGSCTSLEKLYMQGNFFEGAIPSSLSSMRGLTTIDLSHNRLSGQILELLEDLSLSYLNLSYNDFEGMVPTRGVFANASTISVVGNSRLCGGMSKLNLPRCSMNVSKRKHSHVRLVVVIIAACMLFSLVLVSAFIYCTLRMKKRVQSTGPLLKEPLLNLSYGELLHATNGFSSENLIGYGSYASVYKGVLTDQQEQTIAVKVFNLERQGASKSFIAECEALRSIRHRNVLRIITSCSSVDFQGNDFKALVYEFMPNRSLNWWLHSRRGTDEGQEQDQMQMNIHQRLGIVIDVACALDYLHNHCVPPVIHCDLKPSNVLLDEDMVAHVGDFGLAKFLNQLSDSNDTSSIGVRGTVGYAAPEYGLGAELSTKGDVYSYGILLLEMITGKRPTDPVFEGNLNLHNCVEMSLPENVSDVLDPTLLTTIEQEAALSASTEHMAQASSSSDQPRSSNKSKDCLISMLKVGVACSVESPENRMDMNDVVLKLFSVRAILQRS